MSRVFPLRFLLLAILALPLAGQAQEALRIDASPTVLGPNATVQLHVFHGATDVTANPDTFFVVSDETVATISPTGLVTAVAAGEVTIDAHNATLEDEPVSGTIVLRVHPAGDFDGDGMSDAYETAHGLDPNDPADAQADADGDGIDNLTELSLGTDPQKADSDGDGVADAAELAVGSDPVRLQPRPVNLLDENCVVAVLNRTAQVRADGSWILPNVPANFGLVRARATCMEGGVTRSGQSDYFAVPASGIVEVANIHFDVPQPVTASLALTADRTSVPAGETAQLRATATYPGGATAVVTASGTTFTTSNPRIATVGSSGVVTAAGSGTAIISATNEGALAMLRISVAGGSDTDGDGLPNDWEQANGFDPNDPSDAAADADGDGLSNLDEFRNGTAPRNADSDGDGIRDGLELQTGSDPLDALSFDLSRALRSLTVSPAAFTLIVNDLTRDASRQLAVTGKLLDGQTIDLTSAARRTTYASSDLTVCNFGAPDGRVFAGSPGSCTVTVLNSGFTATASVAVEEFLPQPLSSLDLPDWAWNVKVRGSYAYIADGEAGLQVVDIANRRAPAIVASLALPGPAYDVRFSGDFAYIAAGSAGLQVVDIADPLHPALAGGYEFGGEAADVFVAGTLAYVADRAGFLQVISIADPHAPARVGLVQLEGGAEGVWVSGSIALIADPTRFQLVLVNVANPAAPVLLGRVDLPGPAEDVVARNNTAYVAAYFGGLQVVDFSDPSAPRIAGSVEGVFYPHDLALDGSFAFAADELFVNAVPVVDVRDASNPLYRAAIDLSQYGDPNGNGIDADGQYVYLVASSQFLIAQHTQIADDQGIAPAVSILSPRQNATFVEGEQLPVEITAQDDIAVRSVTLLVDGESSGTLSGPPFTTTITVPAGRSSITLGATATDFGSNSASAAPVVVNVIPDPGTTVTGLVNDPAGRAVAGATVTVGAAHATTDGNGRYSIAGVPSIVASIVATASAEIDGEVYYGSSAPAPPVRGGITSMADIIVRPPSGTVGSLELGGNQGGPIDVKDGLAAMMIDGKLRLVTYTDPLAPVLGGSVPLESDIYTLKIVGNYVLASGFENGIIVVDASNPAAPVVVNRFDTPGEAWGMVTQGAHAFVADTGQGLTILDITNPATPSVVTSLPMQRAARDVALSGNLAIVLEQTVFGGGAHAGIDVVDVADPTAPVLLGRFNMPDDGRFIRVSGNYAYIVASSGRIHVIDFSTPGAPVLVKDVDPANRPLDLAIGGPTMYSAAPNNKRTALVPAFDLANPADPQPLPPIAVDPGDFRSVSIGVSGRYVLLLAQNTIEISLTAGANSVGKPPAPSAGKAPKRAKGTAQSGYFGPKLFIIRALN